MATTNQHVRLTTPGVSLSMIHGSWLSYVLVGWDVQPKMAPKCSVIITTRFPVDKSAVVCHLKVLGFVCPAITGLKMHCFWNTLDFYKSLQGKENEKKEEEKATVS